VLLRNFPFVGEVRLTVLTRFRERAIRSFRTIDTLHAHAHHVHDGNQESPQGCCPARFFFSANNTLKPRKTRSFLGY